MRSRYSRGCRFERASDGRVVGATIEQRGADVRRVRANIVIGADGRRSTVARLVEAATCREGRHACGVVYTFWPGLENNRSRWFYRSGVSAGSIPTNNGDACVFAATPQARFHDEIRTDIKAGYRQVLTECAPELAREVAQKAPSEPLRSFPGEPGVILQSYGPAGRWGGLPILQDPITAPALPTRAGRKLLARAVKRGSDQHWSSTIERRAVWTLFDIHRHDRRIECTGQPEAAPPRLSRP